MNPPETVIVGAGLAGMTLAWQLKWLGRPVRIIDRGEPVTASKIAAGLINPITGKRLVVMPRYDFFLQAATAFYQRIERETQSEFFHSTGLVRILKDEFEQERSAKRADREFKSLITKTIPPLSNDIIAQLGSFQIPTAARLDVNRFLDVSRSVFADCYQAESVSLDELESPKTHVFCTGVAAMSGMKYPANCFQPAKGELLTIRVPGLMETRIVNHGVWLMPLGEERFRVGATYSWDQLDAIPTEDARAELIRRLKLFLKTPFEIVDHQAATRPILIDRLPMLGMLSPRVAVFNGLGSKGALLAPYYSQHLAEHLVNGTPIDTDVDVRRFQSQSSGNETPVRNRP